MALSSGQQLTASEICREQFTPQQFGYKILKKLARGDLIKIIRGSEGGCRLCCDLKQVTLYDLIQIMEQDSLVSACMDPEFRCVRKEQNKDHCAIQQNLAKVQEALNFELKKHSLYEILDIGS